MKFYNGVTSEDIPENGGSYVKDHGGGEEQYNFSPRIIDESNEEVMLGFFETKSNKDKTRRNKLHIENINDCEMFKNSDHVDDILVIWCATKKNLGTVVTGWYRHATVYREYQSFKLDNGDIQEYNIIAKKEDCTLLTWQQRGQLNWRIPDSNKDGIGIGQSFQWFGNGAEDFSEQLISYIDEYDKENTNTLENLNKTPTYLDEIVASLIDLNGMASLNEIYNQIESRNKLTYIHKNPNWRDAVRHNIQTHSSDAHSAKQVTEDIFYSVYGLGEGFWGLRSMKKDFDNEQDNPIIKREVEKLENESSINITERDMIIKARIGQGRFREQLLDKYGKCLITGIVTPELLVASHIKPWRASKNNNKERLSVENGLLLSSLYDKMFDNGYISFNDKMQIIISDKLNEHDKALLNIDTTIKYIENPSDEMLGYMNYHRKYIFKG